MTQRWLYVPAQVAADSYGFPALDAPGDQFDAWVAAASSYVAANTKQAESGSPVVYGDSTQAWQTGGSYRYNGCGISPSGIIAYAPHSEPSFCTLDTNTGTLSVFQSPALSFSGYSRWVTVIWDPMASRYIYIPDYEERYVTWDGAATWSVFVPNPYVISGMQRLKGAVYVSDLNYGNVVVGYKANTFVGIDPDYSWGFTTGASAVLPRTFSANGFSNGSLADATISHWALGPGPALFSMGLHGVYRAQYNGSTMVVTQEADISNVSLNTGETKIFGEYVLNTTRPCLGADGYFYVFPEQCDTSSVTTKVSMQYVCRFDPHDPDSTLERFPMKGEPPNDMITADGTNIRGIHAGRVASMNNPVLMPDGRMISSSGYQKQLQRLASDGTESTRESLDPWIWSPAIGGWEQTETTNTSPWGAYPRQWGNHDAGVIGVDGAYYPSPRRLTINGTTGIAEFGGRFSSASDVPPLPEFFASRYKT